MVCQKIYFQILHWHILGCWPLYLCPMRLHSPGISLKTWHQLVLQLSKYNVNCICYNRMRNVPLQCSLSLSLWNLWQCNIQIHIKEHFYKLNDNEDNKRFCDRVGKQNIGSKLHFCLIKRYITIDGTQKLYTSASGLLRGVREKNHPFNPQNY